MSQTQSSILSNLTTHGSSSSNLYNQQAYDPKYYIPPYVLNNWSSIIPGAANDGENNGFRFLWDTFFQQFASAYPEFWNDGSTYADDLTNVFVDAVEGWYNSLDSLYTDNAVSSVDPNNPSQQTHGPRPSSATYSSYKNWLTGSSGGNTWFQDSPDDIASSFSYYLYNNSSAPEQGNSTMLYAFDLLNDLLSQEQNIMYYQSLRMNVYNDAQEEAISGESYAVDQIKDPSSSGDSKTTDQNQQYQTRISIYQSKSSYANSLLSDQNTQVSTINSAISGQASMMTNITDNLNTLISTLFAI